MVDSATTDEYRIYDENLQPDAALHNTDYVLTKVSSSSTKTASSTDSQGGCDSQGSVPRMALCVVTDGVPVDSSNLVVEYGTEGTGGDAEYQLGWNEIILDAFA